MSNDILTRVSKEILAQYINEIVEAAVMHGGDLGGAYMSNPEGLYAILDRFRRWAGLNDYAVVHATYGMALMKPVKLDDEGKVIPE